MNSTLTVNASDIYGSSSNDETKLFVCQPLNYNETMWQNIIILLALGIGFRIVALIGLLLISTPKRVTI